MKRLLIGFFLFSLLLISTCVTTKQTIKRQISKKVELPPVMQEFRAAWVATVANIDWPTKPGLSTEQQKKEAIAILDTLSALNMNAVVLQVRPQCDALYASPLEPWSYYLTGEQGTKPSPYYDPLEFWIEEAHSRGIELHAWFNPYRAHHPQGAEISKHSVVKTRPHLVRQVEGGYHWLDPSIQETQDYSFDVVMDVVKRYDVDGIHFDDYFYPYGDGSFPDDKSWQAYTYNGGSLNRKDWRRDNVNIFIKRLYNAIKKEKIHVKFGISPFGIWRPGNPPSIKGFDQYDMLYADARLWLNEGWIDYWTPQLYWPINQIPQSFPVLLGWWVNENKKDRNIWPGMYTSKVKNKQGVYENLSQIMISRGFMQESPGHVHFSMKAFLNDTLGLNKALKNGPYKNQALVPPSPWLGETAPQKPGINHRVQTDLLQIDWTHPDEKNVFRWVVYVQKDDKWEMFILNKGQQNFEMAILEKNEKGEDINVVNQIAVCAVDRLGNVGEPELVQIKNTQ
ncbi:MAG: hypothetical protein D8M58_04835 [Calditrichaeota bacterium]|nr:MAG: hypothetical protein DWQ03_02240 [Calditrichota bacterium]MBL1204698.1 hypothetical protein [Calditrichota bacterium]NOG44526.1 family 10 glycosylhydrolase [Calditrichota bacterium]